MRDGGKGDAQRPLTVPMKDFDSSWNRIFNKSKIESAIQETIDQHREFLAQLQDHEKDCGK
jgi:hypothetical protein